MLRAKSECKIKTLKDFETPLLSYYSSHGYHRTSKNYRKRPWGRELPADAKDVKKREKNIQRYMKEYKRNNPDQDPRNRVEKSSKSSKYRHQVKSQLSKTLYEFGDEEMFQLSRSKLTESLQFLFWKRYQSKDEVEYLGLVSMFCEQLKKNSILTRLALNGKLEAKDLFKAIIEETDNLSDKISSSQCVKGNHSPVSRRFNAAATVSNASAVKSRCVEPGTYPESGSTSMKCRSSSNLKHGYQSAGRKRFLSSQSTRTQCHRKKSISSCSKPIKNNSIKPVVSGLKFQNARSKELSVVSDSKLQIARSKEPSVISEKKPSSIKILSSSHFEKQIHSNKKQKFSIESKWGVFPGTVFRPSKKPKSKLFQKSKKRKIRIDKDRKDKLRYLDKTSEKLLKRL